MTLTDKSGNSKIAEDPVKVYDELFVFLWHLVLVPLLRSFFTQSFTREFRAWKTVSGQPNLWKLHGLSISIDIDNEDVRFLLVSPLAEGDLTTLSRDILRNKDQIFPYVPLLFATFCPSNLIVSDLGHCPRLEEFA